MKKHIKIVSVAFCLLFAVTALCSCDKKLPDNIDLSVVERDCRAMLDAMIAGDQDAAEALMHEDVLDSETSAMVTEVGPFFQGKGSYSLSMLEVEQDTYGGVAYVDVSYLVQFSDGYEYVAICTVAEGKEGFWGFHILENLTARAPLGLRIAFFVGSLLLIALTVWMVIDCIRRKPDGMALWIILMLCVIKLSFSASFGETAFAWGVGLVLSFSSVGIGDYTSAIELSLPVASVVYFFLRKRLPCKKENADPNA